MREAGPAAPQALVGREERVAPEEQAEPVKIERRVERVAVAIVGQAVPPVGSTCRPMTAQLQQ